MPVLHLLAGPNGSGKTTYVRDVLAPVTHLPFINADEIASRRWPKNQSSHAYDAARIAQAQRQDAIAQQRSFISETVFSHESKVDLVADAAAAGYIVHLHVMIVPVELAVQRVLDRRLHSGHSVPEAKIRARYRRLWSHVGRAIPLADAVHVFDNSRADAPFRLCASYQHGRLMGASEWPRWAPDELTRIEQ